MNSKERVMTALNHQEADRVPLDVGGINNTTMHRLVQERLIRELHLKQKEETLVKSREQGVVVPDESIVDYFGSDTCSIYINETSPWRDNGDGSFTNMWGIVQKINPDGLYYNMVGHPLENADVENIRSADDLDFYKLPEPTEYMVEGLKERIDANRDKCCILEGLREPMFGLPSWLRGNTNYYMDLLMNEEFSDALHEKILNYYKKLLDFIMERIGYGIDIVKFADDMGTQNSLLLSPEVYRERVKPYQQQLYSYVHEKYHKKILLHSCGAIRPLLNDLIEIGVDAINPVQISAKGMDPAELKAEFGDRITFWGGGVDTQQVLNSGSPEDVRKSVEMNLKTFKPGGGYVFAQVHNILPTVPTENILAMYETYQKFADY